MTQVVRLVLVDDHAVLRSGLADLLRGRGGMDVLGDTGKPDEAVALVRQHQPDLVLLDLRLGPIDGLSVLRTLRAEGIETPVVILTMCTAEEDLAGALRAGVRGYLLKDMEPDDVIESIQRAARGELVVAPSMALKLAQMWQQGQKGSVKRDLVDSLTEREREVLEHVARGKSNKVIAQALEISHNTVKLHVRHIMAKLDLGSRVEAAVFAFEHRTSGEGGTAAGGETRK
ncbi:response regulator transcription factor [Curvibacter sp. PAE-UM]|uniref:response regulator n=1 Tax=Curvibacter sp. PAE-UM TaxID=1714344 RepID=UPI000710F20A|nr:response regulator transcription factor [Curvibacter sp. PAE-UM]KRI00122.1 XRE family transcriptional regulator [Curvibacter sp. PAE-UM]